MITYRKSKTFILPPKLGISTFSIILAIMSVEDVFKVVFGELFKVPTL
jgi:hypothetical protein